MGILRDLLNLSNILDDMEQTGIVSYSNRTQYYALYRRDQRLSCPSEGEARGLESAVLLLPLRERHPG